MDYRTAGLELGRRHRLEEIEAGLEIEADPLGDDRTRYEPIDIIELVDPELADRMGADMSDKDDRSTDEILEGWLAGYRS